MSPTPTDKTPTLTASPRPAAKPTAKATTKPTAKPISTAGGRKARLTPAQRQRLPPSRRGLDLSQASVGARRTAGALLQVLAGALTPAEAAEVLQVSAPMVYKLEARALEGFVQGCEPRSKGAPRSMETQLKQLEQEHARLQRECARLQALVRVLQRATGVKPPSSGKAPPTQAKGKRGGKRRRKPTVRAMSLADKVKGDGEPTAAPPAAPPPLTAPPTA